MGGIFQLFDFHQRSMARKILAKKKHVDGMEAPRNSLELQLDASQSYYAAGDLPCFYQVEEDREARNYYQNEASMKKLISEEMSKQSNTRRNAPSIVAKLMGMDPLPSDTKSIVQPVVKKSDNQRAEYSLRDKNVKGSNSNYSKPMEVDSTYSRRDVDAERWNAGLDFGKTRPREHPQEEELQRFKHEFEAYQVTRLRECSKVLNVGSIYADSVQAMHEKPFENGLHHRRHKSEHFKAEQNESRRRSMNKDFRPQSMIDYNEKLDAAPTRIVILKPGPDSIYDHEESCTSSSGTFQERASMEDFLEEVRDRLKADLQGKALNHKKSSVVRGSGIETPFSERSSSDPRHIARHIANQARGNVSRDLGMNLVRSESTRSYRSELQFNGPGSPEFIDKDTRRFLSDRLRNVLKQETQLDATSSVFDNRRDVLKRIQETRSFRYGRDIGLLNKELSPRNLIRSLSAPVSGTSVGKLLLEDRHSLTGARIRTKHEGYETASVKHRRKDKFNLKEKVSNIKYSLSLRRRLFGKKIQSMMESYNADNDLARDILSGPTVTMNFGERHENSTEVPPSPASVCSSSTHEEFWREMDYPSPISTPDVTLGDNNDVPQVFKEISSNLKELRRQLNELESDKAYDVTIEQEPIESEIVNLEDHTQVYVRDLLVASGLYNGSWDKSLSRFDPLAKPISKSAFEQVEDSYRKSTKENDKKVDHKLLLDLSNEALSTILGPQVTMSRFRRKLIGSTVLTPPQGRKLFNCVWEIIHINLYPPNDMVARDRRCIPWTSLVDDETNVLVREVECYIIRDLVEEIVKDMHA